MAREYDPSKYTDVRRCRVGPQCWWGWICPDCGMAQVGFLQIDARKVRRHGLIQKVRRGKDRKYDYLTLKPPFARCADCAQAEIAAIQVGEVNRTQIGLWQLLRRQPVETWWLSGAKHDVTLHDIGNKQFAFCIDGVTHMYNSRLGIIRNVAAAVNSEERFRESDDASLATDIWVMHEMYIEFLIEAGELEEANREYIRKSAQEARGGSSRWQKALLAQPTLEGVGDPDAEGTWEKLRRLRSARYYENRAKKCWEHAPLDANNERYVRHVRDYAREYAQGNQWMLLLSEKAGWMLVSTKGDAHFIDGYILAPAAMVLAEPLMREDEARW
jgi:hypothetical protein